MEIEGGFKMSDSTRTWSLGNGIEITEDGEVSAKPGAKILDTLLESAYNLAQEIHELEALQKAIRKYLIELMSVRHVKSLTDSDNEFKATLRASTYTTQDVQALATDLQSRIDTLPKEFFLELIHAAKGFDTEAIRYDTVRGIVEMYTQKNERQPSVIITRKKDAKENWRHAE
jgi:hypothetical protein